MSNKFVICAVVVVAAVFVYHKYGSKIKSKLGV